MKLELNEIDVECIIGDRDDERNRLQHLRVDVALEITDRAAVTDELSDTVDYYALTQKIRAALIDAKCKMIERAAKIVADVCLEDDKVKSVIAKITKFGSVEHLASAAATVSVSK